MKKKLSNIEEIKLNELFSTIKNCTEEPTISTETIAYILKKVYEKGDIDILIKQLKSDI